MVDKTNTTPEDTEQRVKKSRRKGRKKVEKTGEALQRLEIFYAPIDEVHPNDYNPNRQSDHDFELLLRSMEEDGFTQPIVCVRDKGRIVVVDGEHRWRAAKTLEYKEIPIVIVPMTPEQARIATLRHNRARGSEDIELAAAVIRDLEQLGALDWAQDSLMMDDKEIERLLEDIPAPESLAGEEYGDAWEPGEDGADPTRDLGEKSRDFEGTGGVMTSASASREAADRIRSREKKIKEAKTEEEKEMAKKDCQIFRVAVTFAGDEAALVKKALGAEPANTILAWCKEAD